MGGTRAYIPMPPATNTLIEKAVGADAALAVGRVFGRERIVIPMVRAWRVRVYRERGMTSAQIASAIGVTERTVCRYLSMMGMTRARPACAALA